MGTLAQDAVPAATMPEPQGMRHLMARHAKERFVSLPPRGGEGHPRTEGRDPPHGHAIILRKGTVRDGKKGTLRKNPGEPVQKARSVGNCTRPGSLAQDIRSERRESRKPRIHMGPVHGDAQGARGFLRGLDGTPHRLPPLRIERAT